MRGPSRMPHDVKDRLRTKADQNGHGDSLHLSQYLNHNRTDLGNAQRLVSRHGDDLRYCHPWGRWLVWDGKRWAVDATAEVERRAVETVASIYAEAAGAHSKEERRDLASHAKASESRSRIDAMITLARAMSGIPVLPDDLDNDPWSLNTESGTIDLKTGELRAHRRSDLMTKITPVEYDSEATAPTFKRFLEQILRSEAVRDFLQRAVGYAATGACTEEMLPILHGSGANGKTTFTGAIMDAMGDYAIQAAPDLLMMKRNTHPTELADLFGARFVVCTETEEGRRLAESLVKQLTGRDRIKGRFMRQDFWEFSPTHTVFLGTNHRPEVRGTDHAIWRRLKLIPFDITIPGPEQDKRLSEKLRAEVPGILAWIVRGCLAYQQDGLGEPEQVTKATTGYRTEMDTLAAFLKDRCVIHHRAEVPATPLYHAYQRWCDDSGEASESQRKFGMRLRERGFESFDYTSGPHRDRKGWRGIGLRDDRPDDDGPGGDQDPPKSFAPTADQGATADDQSRPNTDKRDQDAHNVWETGSHRQQSGRNADDHPHLESAIGIGKTWDASDDADDSGPKITIDSSNPSQEGAIPKQGPHRPHRPQTASATRRGTLDADAVAAEIRRSGSGPAKSLAHYLSGPNETRLGYVARAVLIARGMDTAGAEHHDYLRVVEQAASDPANHPLDCDCEACF